MQGSNPMVRFLLTASLVAAVVVLAAACNSALGPEVSPAAVDFGSLESGEIGYGLVELWNPGEEREVRVLVQPSTGVFSSPSVEALALEPASLTTIELRAQATENGDYFGVLTLLWDGGSAEVQLNASVAGVIVDLDRDGVSSDSDCDDGDPSVRPGAEEVCDGKDTDCDGILPDEEADLDGDDQSECEGDCDDSDHTTYEGAAELCDGLDNDCNDLADFSGDGEGDGDADGSLACADCDDSDPTNHPDFVELCDGEDNDCDGLANADLSGEVDSDGDGWLSCSDCNDQSALFAPGAQELCDGLDNDCNGFTDADAVGELDLDGDGVLSCLDCDDDDAGNYPGQTESCDGADNDCNGHADADGSGEVDADLDGSLSCADCNDADAANFPGNVELCDGVDNDCNHVADADGGGEADVDLDGSLSCADCDDADAANYPGNSELCDGADNDCNDLSDADVELEVDADVDGWLSCEECDDSAPLISPSAVEVCDGVDNNCDGAVDENAVFQEFFLKGVNGSSADLWLSEGDGSFSGPTGYSPTGGSAVRGAVAGDFDGDGYLDFLLTLGFNAVRSYLYHSDCEGGFDQVEQSHAGGLQLSGRSNISTAADLDLDGDLDVLGWDFNDGEGWVWLNHGDGLIWDRLPSSSTDVRPFDLQWGPSGSSFREVVAMPPVDMTGDGYPDLVECFNADLGGDFAAASSCQVHAGVGDGTFTSTLAPEFGVLQRINGMALADFDGDGDIDLLGGLDDDGDAGQVWFWAGGSSYPSGQGVESFDINDAVGTGSGDADLPGYGWMSPYDWNGDGAMDVLISSMNPQNSTDRLLTVALNDGIANFTLQTIGTSTHGYGAVYRDVQDIISVPVWP